MSHTTTDTDTRLTDMAANIRQLTDPIHLAHRGHIHTRMCLLDQLRCAVEPAHAETNGRRGIPDSRPPVRVDAVDALATIEVELSGWHARLRLPSPPRDTDWQKTVMRALVGAWPNLPPDHQDWLAADVDSWWRSAAHITGWTLTDLRRLR